MRPAKHFYVYIMTNRPRSHVLYTGVTGNLPRRVFEHKNKLVPGFTARYNLTRLVYYELFYFPGAAIEREKQIKGWSRSKKIALITSLNPKWNDLATGWGDQFKPGASMQRGLVPHARSFGAKAPQDDAFNLRWRHAEDLQVRSISRAVSGMLRTRPAP